MCWGHTRKGADMNYWPGTKIVKSKGNAFDWRKGEDSIASAKEFTKSLKSTQANTGNGTNKRRVFTIYSKAK